jgi:hypothetical protein
MREQKPFEWIHSSPVKAKPVPVGGFFFPGDPTKVVRGDLGPVLGPWGSLGSTDLQWSLVEENCTPTDGPDG